jgi:hypothetical protein
MILHAAATAVALASLVVGVLCLALGAGAALPVALAGSILALLALERGVAGVRATARSRDRWDCSFPLRTASATGVGRGDPRLAGSQGVRARAHARPQHAAGARMRPLILLPARNEVSCLSSVVWEVCRFFPPATC